MTSFLAYTVTGQAGSYNFAHATRLAEYVRTIVQQKQIEKHNQPVVGRREIVMTPVSENEWPTQREKLMQQIGIGAKKVHNVLVYNHATYMFIGNERDFEQHVQEKYGIQLPNEELEKINEIAEEQKILAERAAEYAQQRMSEQAIVRMALRGTAAVHVEQVAKKLSERYDVEWIERENVVDEEIEGGSMLGKQCKKYIEQQKPVPEQIIVDIILERISEHEQADEGYVLTGFPRTPEEARILVDASMIPDMFICLDMPDEAVIERLSNRRYDPATDMEYHLVDNPPENALVSKRLVCRPNDTLDSVCKHLRDFHRYNDDIKSYFLPQLCILPAGKSVTQTFIDIVNFVSGSENF